MYISKQKPLVYEINDYETLKKRNYINVFVHLSQRCLHYIESINISTLGVKLLSAGYHHHENNCLKLNFICDVMTMLSCIDETEFIQNFYSFVSKKNICASLYIFIFSTPLTYGPI